MPPQLPANTNNNNNNNNNGNVTASSPTTATFTRLGWRNPVKHTEGLKSKQNFVVSRDEEGASKIQSCLETCNSNSEVKEMNLYVRRRHFPIMPCGVVNKIFDAQLQKSEKSASMSDDEPSSLVNAGSSEMGNGVASSCSFDELEQFVAKDFSQVLSVVLLDEPLPAFRKKDTVVDATEFFSDYNLPPGARVVGDRVFYPKPKNGLFSGDDDDEAECSLPLSFFKKAPTAFGSTFGQQPAQSSLFGAAPSFGGSAPAFGNSNPFLSNNNNGFGFSTAASKGGFGAPTKGDFDFNFSSSNKTEAKKPKLAAVKAESGQIKSSTSSIFGIPQQQQQQPSFSFGNAMPTSVAVPVPSPGFSFKF